MEALTLAFSASRFVTNINGNWKWKVYGHLQVCFHFKVLLYRDYRSAVKRWTSGVESRYICVVISFPTWWIFQLNATVVSNFKKKMTRCLHLAIVVGLFAFFSSYHFATLLSGLAQHFFVGDMSIRSFEYWEQSMQDHHLNLCIIFIIIIFIAPSHKENSTVLAYRSYKT